jgi:hypothetical protein
VRSVDRKAVRIVMVAQVVGDDMDVMTPALNRFRKVEYPDWRAARRRKRARGGDQNS